MHELLHNQENTMIDYSNRPNHSKKGASWETVRRRLCGNGTELGLEGQLAEQVW